MEPPLDPDALIDEFKELDHEELKGCFVKGPVTAKRVWDCVSSAHHKLMKEGGLNPKHGQIVKRSMNCWKELAEVAGELVTCDNGGVEHDGKMTTKKQTAQDVQSRKGDRRDGCACIRLQSRPKQNMMVKNDLNPTLD